MEKGKKSGEGKEGEKGEKPGGKEGNKGKGNQCTEWHSFKTKIWRINYLSTYKVARASFNCCNDTV